MTYPLKQKIDECLTRKEKNLKWLSVQLGISTKTLYNYKEIGNLSLDVILGFTKALDFNFLEDYNNWLREHNEPAISGWSEKEIEYRREATTQMTLTFSIRGNQDTMVNQFGKLITTIKNECDTYGMEII